MAHSIDGGNVHTKAIAEFVSAFRFDKIPSEILTRIKLLVLDSLDAPSMERLYPGAAFFAKLSGRKIRLPQRRSGEPATVCPRRMRCSRMAHWSRALNLMMSIG
jgi:hypothetical protein